MGHTKWINLADANQCTFVVTIGETGGTPASFRLQSGRRFLFWHIAKDLPDKAITPTAIDNTISRQSGYPTSLVDTRPVVGYNVPSSSATCRESNDAA